jgi:hypothetical protein
METCYALVYFDLPDNYDEYDHIYLHFYMVLAVSDSTFDIEFYRVSESWNETIVTWNTRPSLGTYLFSKQVADHRQYNIGIKENVQSDVFSFYIIGAYPQFNLAQILSKDSGMDSQYIISLILKDVDPVNLPVIFGIIGVVLAVSGGISFYFFKKKRNPSKSDTS